MRLHSFFRNEKRREIAEMKTQVSEKKSLALGVIYSTEFNNSLNNKRRGALRGFEFRGWKSFELEFLQGLQDGLTL